MMRGISRGSFDDRFDLDQAGMITLMPNLGLSWDSIQSNLPAIGENDGAALPVVGAGSDFVAQGDLPSR